MTAKYHVAIPTYQRPQQLMEQTMATLRGKRVPMDQVHVFLHQHDPCLDDYLLMLDLVPGVNVVVTQAQGIGEQRTAITEHFPAGTNIVCMDDDIQGVMSATGRKWADVFQVPDLDLLFTAMFDELHKQGLYVWGLNPVDNPWFLTPGRVSAGLKLVMFTMFGFINRPGHPVHQGTVRYKDEQELSLRAWWYDGGVLRNDGVAVKTKFYAPGGCQAAGRSWEDVDESVQSLLVQWPGLIQRSKKRKDKSPWPEVQLTYKKRTDGHPLDVPPPGAGILASMQALL